LLASISVAIVAVTVGIRLTHGSMTLEAGLLAILLAPEAYWPVRRVGAEFHAAADGAEALSGILPELDRPDDAPPGPGDTSAPTVTDNARPMRDTARLGNRQVRLLDVSYSYPGARSPVLQGFSLDVDRGLTVLTGPSGAGKSTVLELAAGLRTPTSGAVGTAPAHLVSQRPFLPAGTLRDVLRLGNDAPDDALWQALREVGVDGFVAALPAALGTTVGDDGTGLSAGQRARIALARATLSSAPVLLVDEPTAHLDTEASGLVHDLLVRLAGRRAVLVATHRPELIALADLHVELAPAAGHLTARAEAVPR
ncbi:MAG: ATP-binding cassette domain-containing protein, partial [Dermatophilaceae bacterium]